MAEIPPEVVEAAAAAIREGLQLHLGPNALAAACEGHPIRLSGAEADEAARLAAPSLIAHGAAEERAHIADALQAATRAVLDHQWASAAWSAHSAHRYDAECAVCQGDVAAILAVAAPILVGQERRDA